MSKIEFEIGDKVRLVRKDPTHMEHASNVHLNTGRILTISATRSMHEVEEAPENTYGWHPSQFDLVDARGRDSSNELQEGDQVRIIALNNMDEDCEPLVNNGKIYIIDGIDSDGISLKDPTQSEDGAEDWYWEEDCLQRINNHAFGNKRLLCL